MSLFSRLLLNLNSEPKESQIIRYVATKKLNVSDVANSKIRTHEYNEDTGEGTIVCASAITRISGFNNCEELKEITLPESVNSIVGSAFDGCNLDKLILPTTITSIGFSNCKISQLVIDNTDFWFNVNFKGFTEATLYDKLYNKISEINVPNNITSISSSLFKNIKGLETVNISSSISEIGEEAFYNCSDLNTINIESNNDILIQKSAFRYCENLENINTTSTININGGYNFENCKKLKKLPALSPSMITIYSSTFESCESLESVTIPDNIKTINSYAFSDCISLKTVQLSKNVKVIPENCFYNCSSLVEIDISNVTQSIGAHAFENCTNLTSVTLGYLDVYSYAFANTGISSISLDASKYIADGVCANCKNLVSIEIGTYIKEIGSSAFSNCDNLEYVTIPNNVTKLSSSFTNCPKLKEVNVGSGVTNLDSSTFENSGDGDLVINVDENNLNFCSENGIVFNKNKTILHIYKLDKLQDEYTIPETVTTIRGAFYDCKYLRNVIFHAGVTTIDGGSFKNCIFEELILPENLTSLAYGAITKCTNLTNVYIPSNITKNVEYNFDGCHKLIINVNENNSAYTAIDGVLFDKGKTKLLRYRKDEIVPNYEIPNIETLITIGNNSFASCTYLKNITIPNTITSIGAYAFSSTGLVTINLPNSVTLINNYAFSGSDLESIQMNDCVCTIKSHAFDADNIEYIYVNSLEQWLSCTIDTSSSFFNPFEKGAGLYINNKLLTDLSLSGNYNIVPGTFTYYKHLNKINLDITSIEVNSFRGCTNLKEAIINCDTIKGYTFFDCENLETIYVGEKVSSIEDVAFNNCSSLKKVNVPSLYNWCNMEHIDLYLMFYAKCLYINDVLLEGVVTTPENISVIKSNTFRHNSTITKLIFREGVTTIEQAFRDCENLEQIDFPSTLSSLNYANMFQGLSSLKLINIRAKNVPTTSQYAFDQINTKGTLYYPKGSDYSSWLNKLKQYKWTSVEVDFENL